jgi:hypothetical protein
MAQGHVTLLPRLGGRCLAAGAEGIHGDGVGDLAAGYASMANHEERMATICYAMTLHVRHSSCR